MGYHNRGLSEVIFFFIFFTSYIRRKIKMVGKEISKEMVDKVLEAIEIAKATGKIKKEQMKLQKLLKEELQK